MEGRSSKYKKEIIRIINKNFIDNVVEVRNQRWTDDSCIAEIHH